MRVEILGVPFDNVTDKEALARLMSFLDDGASHIICTPNPEMVMLAGDDPDFMKILQSADLVVPDGIGVVIASRLLGTPLAQRVAGCDLMYALFGAIKDTEYTVYLLGGKPGVAAQASENMRREFPGLKIAGYRDGYFNAQGEAQLLEELRELAPDILLAGMGMGRQEKWIYQNRGLPVRLLAGVGGSLDVMAGTVRRAPPCFQRLGLEWFYRLLCEPSRAGRMLKLPAFVIKVLLRRGRHN